jgi:hypothetical protein
MTPSRRKIHALLVSVVILAGCATTPPPLTEVDDARAAVARAREAGAEALAPVDLRMAEDRLVRAEAALAAEDYKAALPLARQAGVDAELALANARHARARRAVEERSADNARLRRELLGEGQRP